MRKIGLWLLVLLALAGAAAIAYYFLKPLAPNVGLEFSKPDQIYVGLPFTLTVSYSNSSDQVLKDSKFSIQLPLDKSITFLGQPVDQVVREESLGDIGPGSVNQENINLIALGGAQSFKRVTAKLNYTTQSANGTAYEASSNADLSIGLSAVNLTIVTPQSANSGENFDTDVKIQNNTADDLKNITFNLSYPPVFKFVKSNKDNLINNQQFNWPVLMKNQSDDIMISGNLLGADLSRYDFTANITANYMGQTYTINSQTSQTSISPSPLVMRTTINGADSASFIAQAGQALEYAIYYKNNSSVALSNLKLSTGLVGTMFDFSTLKTDAIFNSITNVLNWTQQNSPNLAVLNPGEEKQVSFQIKLKSTFPIQRLGDKNFTLKLKDLTLESPTVPPGVAAQKTVSIAQLENKVAGQVALKASGYFYDAASGILNKGPYPPRVNQKTQYTVHWTVTNYSTDVSGVVVTANLASGGNFTGQIKSNASSQPAYDSTTGIVTWNLGNIPAIKGVISPPYEGIFQIEYTPSSVQAGEEIQLMGVSSLSALDTFTNSQLTASDVEITTNLPDDTKINTQDRRVKP